MGVIPSRVGSPLSPLALTVSSQRPSNLINHLLGLVKLQHRFYLHSKGEFFGVSNRMFDRHEIDPVFGKE